jgi:hypothetical protein
MSRHRIKGVIDIDNEVWDELVKRNLVYNDNRALRIEEFVSNTLVNRMNELAPDLELDSGAAYFDTFLVEE